MNKIFKVLRIVKYAIFDSENFLLRILEEETKDYLKYFAKLKVVNTEDFEDLLYHIKSYIDLPETLKSTLYDSGNKYNLVEYIEDLEKLRAVERDYIFELVKDLPLGFKL